MSSRRRCVYRRQNCWLSAVIGTHSCEITPIKPMLWKVLHQVLHYSSILLPETVKFLNRTSNKLKFSISNCLSASEYSVLCYTPHSEHIQSCIMNRKPGGIWPNCVDNPCWKTSSYEPVKKKKKMNISDKKIAVFK